MFCKKCGSQLDDNALFCSNCGEKCDSNANAFNEKPAAEFKQSVFETILRLMNIVVFVVAFLLGVVQILMSNVIGGIIILLFVALVIAFVFRKTQIAKIKNKIPNEMIRKIIVITIYFLLPLLMFASIGIAASLTEDSGVSSANHDAIAISYAESNLKNQLKNPESLQIHSSEVYVDFEWGDYHYYTITIDYSAQNSFGGYNRNNDYDVILKINKNTNVASKVTTEEYLDAITKYNNSK